MCHNKSTVNEAKKENQLSFYDNCVHLSLFLFFLILCMSVAEDYPKACALFFSFLLVRTVASSRHPFFSLFLSFVCFALTSNFPFPVMWLTRKLASLASFDRKLKRPGAKSIEETKKKQQQQRSKKKSRTNSEPLNTSSRPIHPSRGKQQDARSTKSAIKCGATVKSMSIMDPTTKPLPPILSSSAQVCPLPTFSTQPFFLLTVKNRCVD